MEKKVMLIGRSQVGKTTLAQAITGREIKFKKTQYVQRIENFIDVPGEYIEIPHFYKALLVTSYDANIIVLVESVLEENSIFPPKFASAFNKPTIGVVTKTDLGGDVAKSSKNLLRAGAKEIFAVSYKDKDSMEPLIEYLNR